MFLYLIYGNERIEGFGGFCDSGASNNWRNLTRIAIHPIPCSLSLSSALSSSFWLGLFFSDSDVNPLYLGIFLNMQLYGLTFTHLILHITHITGITIYS